MTTPSSVPAGRFEIVRSIIHQCPALKLPQSFVERLGGVAQIVALKGATNEFAEHVADCLNASVPAQGGQQPAGVTFPMPDKPGLTMACFDAQTVPVRTPLYTAPAAPAAPLTEDTLRKIAFEVGMFDTDVTGELCDRFARAIEAAHGITLAGTAQKGE